MTNPQGNPGGNIGAEIAAHGAYTLAEFSRRTGLKRWAIRRLRRDGLVIRKACGRAFVLGKDWISFLERGADGGKKVNLAQLSDSGACP